MSAGGTGRKIRVLVVEDSPVIRELLVHILSADTDIQVIGTASNGEEAITAAKLKQPDIITMDFHMPKMNGMEATRKIMETHPVPIIIVSGSSVHGEVATAFSMLEAGALAMAEKPAGPGQPGHEAAASYLVQTVKLMAEVKVIRRWPKREAETSVTTPARVSVELASVQKEIKLIAIGASTGGPLVIKTILSGLPKDFPVPILIVQHIAAGFTEGFVEWLTRSSGFAARIATDGEYPLPGYAYVAPDEFHMELARNGRIALSVGEPVNGHRPSVSQLFRSVTTVLGGNAVGVLLTGMGKDGAEELKWMRAAGAVTIAQDQASSVVHGMPGEALQLDAAMYVLSPDAIVTTLPELVRRNRKDRA